jgi:hypothetical protein
MTSYFSILMPNEIIEASAGDLEVSANALPTKDKVTIIQNIFLSLMVLDI